MRAQLRCIHCDQPYIGNSPSQKRCGVCRDKVASIISRAQAKARAAARRGDLPNLLDPRVFVACADCGERATQWDHRDYSRPTDVAPVCKRCNLRRGPGLVPGAIGDVSFRYVKPAGRWWHSWCRICKKLDRPARGKSMFGYCAGCREETGRTPLSVIEANLSERTLRRYQEAA